MVEEREPNQLNIKLPPELLKKFKTIGTKGSRSAMLRTAIEAIVRGEASSNGADQVAKQISDIGLVGAISNYSTHNFSDDLYGSKCFWLITDNLLHFITTHQHLRGLESRFKKCLDTVIHMPLSSVDGAAPSTLSAENALAFEKIKSTFGQDLVLQNYIKNRQANVRTPFMVVPFVPLQASSPAFALATDDRLYVSLPTINSRSIDRWQTRAIALTASGETLWYQLGMLREVIPEHPDILTDWLISEGHIPPEDE